MSSEERRKILQMVADGKINAEEAANFDASLDESAEENVDDRAVRFEASGFSEERTDSTEFDEVRRRASVFKRIPWVGDPLHCFKRMGACLPFNKIRIKLLVLLPWHAFDARDFIDGTWLGEVGAHAGCI